MSAHSLSQRVHLRAHGREQAVCRHQQAALGFVLPPLAVFKQRGHAIGAVPIAHHAFTQAYGAGTQPLLHRARQQHLQCTTVHRVLRPPVAGQQAARLGIDVVAVAAHQRPFARRQADGGQLRVVDAQVHQLAHGIRLQVDAHAEWLEFRHRLVDDARHADLVQRQGQRHAADAAAGNQHGLLVSGFTHGVPFR